mmetsp:Transcript_113116/g.325178  ORF Transcript_113116/g.325178 Transcript_113116/m.325178 type:complete len:232 (+) Transcript_113116:96-791(+)
MTPGDPRSPGHFLDVALRRDLEAPGAVHGLHELAEVRAGVRAQARPISRHGRSDDVQGSTTGGGNLDAELLVSGLRERPREPTLDLLGAGAGLEVLVRHDVGVDVGSHRAPDHENPRAWRWLATAAPHRKETRGRPHCTVLVANEKMPRHGDPLVMPHQVVEARIDFLRGARQLCLVRLDAVVVPLERTVPVAVRHLATAIPAELFGEGRLLAESPGHHSDGHATAAALTD